MLIRNPRRRFEAQALFSTGPALSLREVLEYYMRRWQLKVTFEEARRHLGFETQRQWSDQAIVPLLALRLMRAGTLPLRQAAWYAKRRPTFTDARAPVEHGWR